ncbi:hypothetical protein RIF29_41589 [Crotalaria pallida]|uniref:Uncharacterized protein n=1 Tax=Crotalaria pallida TaxID=3830 RepID=A0AAN9HRN7_CROPI
MSFVAKGDIIAGEVRERVLLAHISALEVELFTDSAQSFSIGNILTYMPQMIYTQQSIELVVVHDQHSIRGLMFRVPLEPVTVVEDGYELLAYAH